jgi:hypothetical protein
MSQKEEPRRRVEPTGEGASKTPGDQVTPDGEAKIPAAPNEGRLGPAADPVEGKRD